MMPLVLLRWPKCATSKTKLRASQLQCWLVYARKNWWWPDVHMLRIWSLYNTDYMVTICSIEYFNVDFCWCYNKCMLALYADYFLWRWPDFDDIVEGWGFWWWRCVISLVKNGIRRSISDSPNETPNMMCGRTCPCHWAEIKESASSH